MQLWSVVSIGLLGANSTIKVFRFGMYSPLVIGGNVWFRRELRCGAYLECPEKIGSVRSNRKMQSTFAPGSLWESVGQDCECYVVEHTWNGLAVCDDASQESGNWNSEAHRKQVNNGLVQRNENTPEASM
jgi:hypothetical protein